MCKFGGRLSCFETWLERYVYWWGKNRFESGRSEAYRLEDCWIEFLCVCALKKRLSACFPKWSRRDGWPSLIRLRIKRQPLSSLRRIKAMRGNLQSKMSFAKRSGYYFWWFSCVSMQVLHQSHVGGDNNSGEVAQNKRKKGPVAYLKLMVAKGFFQLWSFSFDQFAGEWKKCLMHRGLRKMKDHKMETRVLKLGRCNDAST